MRLQDIPLDSPRMSVLQDASPGCFPGCYTGCLPCYPGTVPVLISLIPSVDLSALSQAVVDKLCTASSTSIINSLTWWERGCGMLGGGGEGISWDEGKRGSRGCGMSGGGGGRDCERDRGRRGIEGEG